MFNPSSQSDARVFSTPSSTVKIQVEKLVAETSLRSQDLEHCQRDSGRGFPRVISIHDLCQLEPAQLRFPSSDKEKKNTTISLGNTAEEVCRTACNSIITARSKERFQERCKVVLINSVYIYTKDLIEQSSLAVHRRV